MESQDRGVRRGYQPKAKNSRVGPLAGRDWFPARPVVVLTTLILSALPCRAECVFDSAYSTMTYHDGALYSALEQGNFAAVDIGSRKIKWTYEDSNGCQFTTPAFLGSSLFVAMSTKSDGSQIVALDHLTGRLLWHLRWGELGGNPSPVVCEDTVLVNEFMTGRVAGLDGDSGVVRWDTQEAPLHFFHPPAVSGSDALYVVKKKGADSALGIAALDCSTGGIRQVIPVENVGVSRHPIMLHQGKTILVREDVHSASTITLFDLSGRQRIWQMKFPEVVGSPVLWRDRLIFGPDGIRMVDLKTGKVVLHHPTEESVQPFTMYHDTVIFNTGSRSVAALRLEPPQVVWQVQLAEQLQSNVVLCGEAVCVRVGRGTLALLSPKDGKTLGTISLLPTAE